MGWEDASKYLVLPVLLVVAQFASSAIISPPIKDDDQNAGFTKVRVYAFLSLSLHGLLICTSNQIDDTMTLW